tara:strand:- start:135 stop:356 length:222 start_codon:yes stop_codon:yes gene_type:complete
MCTPRPVVELLAHIIIIIVFLFSISSEKGLKQEMRQVFQKKKSINPSFFVTMKQTFQQTCLFFTFFSLLSLIT